MNKLFFLAITGLFFILPNASAQELKGKDFDLGMVSSDFDLGNKYTETRLDATLSRINKRLNELERAINHQKKRRKTARRRSSRIVRTTAQPCLPPVSMPVFRPMPMGPPPMMMGGGGRMPMMGGGGGGCSGGG
jgi:hypothetical protein